MNKKLIKGSVDPLIIKLLLDHGRMYGYEICQRIKALSDDQIAISEAALYPALHRLEASDLLDSVTELAKGRPRKYYFIAPKKAQEANQLLIDFNQLLASLNSLLKPSNLSHG